MDILNNFIDNSTLPVLTALLLGILTSISPCPLATNIAAIAYLSKNLKTVKNTLTNGAYYALGRAASYTGLAIFIYYGLSVFVISKSVQDWGQNLLGPFLIIIGLAMLGAIKINLPDGGGKLEKAKLWVAGKGSLGAFSLGAMFALAFCPYSALLFFGALIPLVLKSSGGLLLPPVFALGTALPVVAFSFLIAFSAQKLGAAFRVMQKIEKAMRYAVAFIFLAVGAYYLRFLVGI
ncbi:MAG: aromatic aminobenezylarsenical efflux permease ArsG family transporter [Candidatus Pacebacteria bacterium]|jgi:cytochrome c biogenesis protein CcdA|nr:aromatic aminobenezylarsenical efflux permease ArsG family transporter [Candidatus Paceibacterota bacterium]